MNFFEKQLKGRLIYALENKNFYNENKYRQQCS